MNRDDWIIESNDRAEELFCRKLPKTGVSALPSNFNDLIQCRVREKVQEGEERPQNPEYEFITRKVVKEMRSSGQASAYYARLIEGPFKPASAQSRWIRVHATPVMHPYRGVGGKLEIGMDEVFATITDIAPSTVKALEQYIAANTPPVEGA